MQTVEFSNIYKDFNVLPETQRGYRYDLCTVYIVLLPNVSSHFSILQYSLYFQILWVKFVFNETLHNYRGLSAVSSHIILFVFQWT